MNSLPDGFKAIVVGASGALGGAFVETLRARPNCAEVVGLGRATLPALDLEDEASIAAAALALQTQAPFHLVVNATGALHIGGVAPEKRLDELDAATLARAFAINAIGPALLVKHFAPLLPRQQRGLFASLSARVGSIGDNRKGGWYSYRAAKAAQNMLLKTAAIELARRQPLTVLVALHPGTVRSPLSAPILGDAPATAPAVAVVQMLHVLDGLSPADSGGFFAYDGSVIVW
jgi:NAD(P)-dependent dehydrogenase (short-subunit alcohol dehydrogenase family)